MKKPLWQRAYEKALFLFKSQIVESSIVRIKGSVLKPISMKHADGSLAAWFVPVIVKDKIVGFFQFSTSLELLRYASFQKNPEDIENCPLAVLWLDSEKIRERAAILALSDEKLSTPYLTYDVDISRVVWAIVATKPNGENRRIFVVGTEVFNEMDRSSPFTGKL